MEKIIIEGKRNTAEFDFSEVNQELSSGNLKER